MLYAVLFTDNAEHADIRRRLMPAHLGFLERNRYRVGAAGPLLDREAKVPADYGWSMPTAPEAVMALVQADPFWPTGLRNDVRVLQWKQVFAQT